MRNYPLIALIFLSAALYLTQCSYDRTERHSFKVEEIDGVLTAVNTGGPKYSEELFDYEKILTLVSDPNKPESFLNDPRSVRMDEQGYFYVSDLGDCRIAVFDSTGHYVNSIGKPGDGPGEFRAVWLRDIQGDVLTIYDSRHRRTTLYRTDGTLLEIFTFPKAAPMVMSQHRAPEDLMVVISMPYETRDNLQYYQARFTTLTAELDTVGTAETALVPTTFRSTLYFGDQQMALYEPIPFAADPQALYVAGTGVLLSTGVDPILWWHKLDGAVRMKISVDLSRVSVTAEDRAARLARLNRLIDEAEGDRKRSLRSSRENIVFAQARPYWSSVSVDDAGFVWLQVLESSEEREEAGGGFLYRVLSPDGEYIGLTRRPATGMFDRGHLLAFATNPDTDEYVPTVWRLVPQSKEFVYP